jgi:ketosteroid isomerase-like protein
MTCVGAAVLVMISLADVPALAADAAMVQEAAEGWTPAALKQDAAGLQRFLADDLQYAHASGNTQNKQQYIAAVLKGPPRYEAFTFSDVMVKFYGNAAVLTGYVDVKWSARIRSARARYRCMWKTIPSGKWPPINRRE